MCSDSWKSDKVEEVLVFYVALKIIHAYGDCPDQMQEEILYHMDRLVCNEGKPPKHGI